MYRFKFFIMIPRGYLLDTHLVSKEKRIKTLKVVDFLHRVNSLWPWALPEVKKSDSLFDFFSFFENYLHYIKNWLLEKTKKPLATTRIKGLGPKGLVQFTTPAQHWWYTLPKYLLTTCAHELNHVLKKKAKETK
jgi:hypothetical protein